jgi:carboxyl-terminal processing protease
MNFSTTIRVLKLVVMLILILTVAFVAYSYVFPKSILTQALDILEADHINSSKVNWQTLRKEASEKEVKGGTREAIAYVILKLGDKHTSYIPAGAPLSNMMNGIGSTTIENASSGVVGRIDQDIAIIEIPTFAFPLDHPETHQFIQKVGAELARLSQIKPGAWIVDLRKNSGGNMWAMIAALGCFFEPGIIGSATDSNGVEGPWAIGEKGDVGIQSRWIFHSQAKNLMLCPIALRKQALAVLVGPQTGSAGEAVAIAFLSRSNTTLYGGVTAGFTTINSAERLSDGSILAVTTRLMRDKFGRSFPDGIDPGSIGKQGRSVPANQDVLKAAISGFRDK